MVQRKRQLVLIKKVTRLLENNRYLEAAGMIHEEESKSSIINNIRNLLKQKQYKEALKLLAEMGNFGNGGDFVFQVLVTTTLPEEVQDAVLQKFLEAQNNYPNYHPSGMAWEHDLRAFTPILWERKLYKWLEKFYLAVFQASKPIHYYSTYEFELIYQFARYANWSDDPKTFGLSSGTVPSDFRYRDHEFVMSRLRLSPFKSEKEYLFWWFEHSNVSHDWLDKLDELHAEIINLQGKGVNARNLVQLEKRIVKKLVSKLTKRAHSPLDSYDRKRLAADVKKVFEFLMKVAYDKDKFKSIDNGKN